MNTPLRGAVEITRGSDVRFLSNELQPLFYLCERFLSDKTAKQGAAMNELALMLAKLQPLMKQAGVV